MSYVQNLLHIVFRTYASQNTLPTDDRVKILYQYIWGVIKNKGGYLYRINSMSDHVHILATLPSNVSLSDFMQIIKGSSSKYLKEKEEFSSFKGWGSRYAAISYNLKDKDIIIKYIKNQQEHHKTVTFYDEFVSMVKEMGIDFDDKDWNR